MFKKKDKRKENKNQAVNEDETVLRGRGRSFAIAEAHKRLRTNIIFSFTDDSSCRVVGVTSSIAHEGKSTTSMNLAYDMLQAGKKVLLIDADMRLSKYEETLGIKRSPGLSNILVGDNNGENIIQQVPDMGNLSVIACGDIPPNPTELLSSKRMNFLLENLKKSFNYIIIDLPPVALVSDALIVSKLCDGMAVVVRQDYVDKNTLDDTVRQLKFNDANIIGFVLTCASAGGKYYKKKYYSKYGRYGRYSKYGTYYGAYYGAYARKSNDEE